MSIFLGGATERQKIIIHCGEARPWRKDSQICIHFRYEKGYWAW